MAKDFQQLTIKDSFMFAAVMADSEKCRRFIEIALDMKVLHVTVITKKALFYHPNYHSVRLDVLAEEHGTQRRFNVEMQVERLKCLPQRTRYYHAQMNMDILAAGLDYIHLPNTYVIFICDFSPFESGERRYRYTFRNRCDENGRLEGRQESRREAIIDLLQMHGTVPTDILDRINLEENPDILKQWHLVAARSASFEDFRKNIEYLHRFRGILCILNTASTFLLLKNPRYLHQQSGRHRGFFCALLQLLLNVHQRHSNAGTEFPSRQSPRSYKLNIVLLPIDIAKNS